MLATIYGHFNLWENLLPINWVIAIAYACGISLCLHAVYCVSFFTKVKYILLILTIFSRRAKQYYDKMHQEDAPSDFRSISILPQFEDLVSDPEVYLRTNLVGLAYRRLVNLYLI